MKSRPTLHQLHDQFIAELKSAKKLHSKKKDHERFRNNKLSVIRHLKLHLLYSNNNIVPRFTTFDKRLLFFQWKAFV